MQVLLLTVMAAMLLRPSGAMDSVSAACRLFVTAVLPGLLPYMVFSSMLVSRMQVCSPVLLTLLGWCGGSPTGARLAAMSPGLTGWQRWFVNVATATMSPMFLLGTCGLWLGSARAGAVLLASVLAGGAVTGWLAVYCQGMSRGGEMPRTSPERKNAEKLSLGMAVEQTARTLLTVCGTMAVWRMLADMVSRLLPAVSLPLTTLMEVTTGVGRLAELPLPLAWRTALIAGATGFGGAAILAQNRAVTPAEHAMPLALQALWQAVHGGISFLLALALMLLTERV